MGGKILQLETKRLYNEAENCLSELLKATMAAKNQKDFDRALNDPSSRGELCQKYGIKRPGDH